MEVAFLAVPWDSGRRGWRMGAGPEALLEGGVTRGLEDAGHQVSVAEVTAPGDPPPPEIRLAFDLVADLARRAVSAAEEGALPVALSGMCFASLGILSAVPRPAGVLWFDCHGDLNTPDTTRSGFLDGTALATALGLCWQGLTEGIPGFEPVEEDHALLLGARDLDAGEVELLSRRRVRSLTSEALARDAGAALAPLAEADIENLYVHLDLDVLDPSEGEVNSMAMPGGLTVAQLVKILETTRRDFRVAGVTLSAYDPSGDSQNRIPAAALDLLLALVS